MKKLHILFLSLFAIANINTSLQAYISEAKKEQIRQEFEKAVGNDNVVPMFFIASIVTSYILYGVKNLLGLSDHDQYNLIPIAGGLACGLNASNNMHNCFEKKVKQFAFAKCNEYNLSSDECYEALRKSEPFQELFYNDSPIYKTPKEFKDEYNKTK